MALDYRDAILGTVVKLLRFWSDLSMWNKYGLRAVMAIGLLVLIFIIFF